MDKVNITIIGAGVIGLAVATEISKRKRDVIVLEQHRSFGQDTSSRNSEVIHAGIYYVKGSLKAKFCVEGKMLLYDLCRQANIPHRRLGKLIVATNKHETRQLENLLRRGQENGVQDLHFSCKKELANYEPALRCIQALHSPSTGIVDSHALMKYLEFKAIQQDVLIAYNTKVIGINRGQNGYLLKIIDADGGKTDFISEIVINCAGLHADTIAGMVGIKIDEVGYSLCYSKGEYFKVRGKNAIPGNILVYRARKGYAVGIHTVIDLQGQVKLGPTMHRMEKEVDYSVDLCHKEEVFEDCQEFLPFLKLEDLSLDMAGIRSSLQGRERDFIIAEEEALGFPNFINLIGIESPGLTSCLAIAKIVKHLLEQ